MDDQNKGLNERWAPGAQPRDRAGEPGSRSADSTADGADDTLGDTAERTREIRFEIDRTRDDISETIDAIQDRLSPRNVVSRAAGNVREATVGKVREMAHQVQDSMPSFGRDYSNGGIVDRIRDNPVPAAIAAADRGGMAVGSRAGNSEDVRRGVVAAGRLDLASLAIATQEFGRPMYASMRGGAPYVRDTRTDLGESESESHGWADSGSQWRSDRRHSMQRRGGQLRTARRRAERMADERPFAAGAIAAAVGLAIGLAIPETQREDELMGEAKEALMERGRETVRDAAGRVQNAASEVQRVAGEALSGGSTSGGNKPGASGSS